MKRILLILVGGTICTELNERGNLSVGDKAGALLVSEFEKCDSPYADKVEFDLTENLYILSENMTVDKWNKMIDVYYRYTEDKKYDGIIFAHGTDTLAYSASLFAQLLSDTEIPAFFVSAHRPLTDKETNGNDNFRTAVECICREISPNVYVAYKNITDGRMYLHLGSRIVQCENYSDDFYSNGAIDITDINESNYKEYFENIREKYPPEKRKSSITQNIGKKLKRCVLMIEPYVSIDYSAFDYGKYRAVLHGAYHSGTACVSTENVNESILYMISECVKSGVDTYISPSIMRKGTYETVADMGESKENGEGINFLYGYTKETAYTKLLIAYSFFDGDPRIKEYINTERNFEMIEKAGEKKWQLRDYSKKIRI